MSQSTIFNLVAARASDNVVWEVLYLVVHAVVDDSGVEDTEHGCRDCRKEEQNELHH